MDSDEYSNDEEDDGVFIENQVLDSNEEIERKRSQIVSNSNIHGELEQFINAEQQQPNRQQVVANYNNNNLNNTYDVSDLNNYDEAEDGGVDEEFGVSSHLNANRNQQAGTLDMTQPVDNRHALLYTDNVAGVTGNMNSRRHHKPSTSSTVSSSRSINSLKENNKLSDENEDNDSYASCTEEIENVPPISVTAGNPAHQNLQNERINNASQLTVASGNQTIDAKNSSKLKSSQLEKLSKLTCTIFVESYEDYSYSMRNSMSNQSDSSLKEFEQNELDMVSSVQQRQQASISQLRPNDEEFMFQSAPISYDLLVCMKENGAKPPLASSVQSSVNIGASNFRFLFYFILLLFMFGRFRIGRSYIFLSTPISILKQRKKIIN